MTAAPTHLVLMPTYNTGPRLREVVAEARRHWSHVMVVVDGSTDGSEKAVLAMAETDPSLSLLLLPRNAGKGAAVLAGAAAAQARGFTHALVMDADGQHPAASIGEFMRTSQRHPEAMVLGRPVFPPNIPAARLHGRKLSVWLVRFELFGAGIADPLFGFRIYPLAPLLAVLGPRRGGRRYDFDTESSVRLWWAGVPSHNLAAPVRYFSRAEGGVSHFRYVRDNVTQVWLHVRLIVELLLWRWPAVLGRRRRSLAVGALVVMLALAPVLHAAADSLAEPARRLAANDPAWRDVAEAFAHRPEAVADFAEQRFFPFKKAPVELKGQARVSAAGGLSLHYTAPDERTVVLDARGMIERRADGDVAGPSDPRASAANAALVQVLRFDLSALAANFEIFGRRDGEAWTLTLVPRAEELRRTVGEIIVAGQAAEVHRIAIGRKATQRIEILIGPARPATFTAEEMRRFFR